MEWSSERRIPAGHHSTTQPLHHFLYTPPMAWPTSLQTGLKEWATVCHALEAGRQVVLLRKGGIYESAGEFEVENREFLLFPTFLHQNLRMLKPEAHAGFEPHPAEPSPGKPAAAGGGAANNPPAPRGERAGRADGRRRPPPPADRPLQP